MNIGSLGPPLQGLETVGRMQSPNAKVTAESPPGVDFSLALKQQAVPRTTEQSGKGQHNSKPQAADPILEFMDSIESELGIEPTRLVGAMGKLNEQELLSAPEDSIEPLVDELGLMGAEEQFFKSKYLEMAQQWQQQPAAEDSSVGAESYPQALAALAAAKQGSQPSSPKPEQMLSEHGASPKQELNSSIDRMNQKFFMKGEYSKGSKAARSLEDLSPREIMGEGYPLAATALPKMEVPAAEGFQQEQVLPEDKNTGKNFAALGGLGAMASELSMAPESQAVPSTMGALGPAGQAVNPDMISKLQSEGLDQESFPMEGLELTSPLETGGQQTASGFSESFSSETNSDGEAFEGEGSSESMPQMFGAQEAMGEKSSSQRPLGSLGAAAGLQQQSSAMGEDHASQNVSNMIEQARFIAKGGGGDMQVRLTPEGMGQVDLKVTVENGVVNVEMMADTAEARELLERHKEDLRVGLSEQNLPIKEIKIGSGPQSFAQDDFGQTNQDREQSQDLARQFMEQFRHQNQKSRNGIFEVPGFKGYKKTAAYADGLAPLQNSPRNNKAEGGHIYVVA